MKYLNPKGTRDLIGNDFNEIDYISKSILKTLESFAYKQVRTPNFESLDLLTKDCGEEMLDQIYSFEDKGGRKYGLKSDITPALTRIISKIGTSQTKPIKLCTYDRVYRYERPQTGRYREITQINAEMYGCSTPVSDAECIATLVACYKELGLNDFKIVIGYRPILVKFLESVGLPDNLLLSVIRIIDKKNRIAEKEIIDELTSVFPNIDLLRIKAYLNLCGNSKSIISKSKTFFSSETEILNYINNLEGIINELELFKISEYCTVDLSLARGSAYYTGIIFETFVEGENSLTSVGSGGRYDNLVKQYGGKDIPAVGFSIGLDRLSIALNGKTKFLKYNPNSDYFVMCENSDLTKQAAYKVAILLRNKGFTVEMNLLDRNISEQFSTAKTKAKIGILFKNEDVINNKCLEIEFSTWSEKTISIDEYFADKIVVNASESRATGYY